MDSDVVQAFNKALVSMYDAKPPISKQKIFDITKAAMNAVRYFKHVVFIVEKFLVKCRTEYKISGLYVIDSIVRQARKQYQHKDVFAPRFAVNLQNTFANILSCEASDRLKAVRVINLWLANKIFDEDVIEPLLQHCRAMGLEVDTEKVEVIVKGDKANMQIYGAEAGMMSSSQLHDSSDTTSPAKKLSRPTKVAVPKTPPLELRPKTPPESSFENSMDNSLNERDIIGLLENYSASLAKLITPDKQAVGRVLKMVNDRLAERLEIERRRQGNIKNLLSREFDYSDEEDDDDNRHKNETSLLNISKDHLLSTARSLFTDNSLDSELQSLRQEIVTRPHRNTQERPKTPPNAEIPCGVPPVANNEEFSSVSTYGVPPREGQTFTAMPTSDNKLETFHDRNPRKRGRSRSRSFERDHDFRDTRRNDLSVDDSRRSLRDARDGRRGERDRRSDRKQRRSRSLSPNADATKSSSRHRERDDRDRRRAEEERERERERERRRNGLPTRPKEAHVLIASRTLWFGRIPSQCTESDITSVVKDVGVPERVNIVAPRACAYVTMKERRAAFKIIDRHDKDPIQMQRRNIKLSWATITGLKDNDKLMDYWDVNRGVAVIPFSKLPENLDTLLDGAHLDVDTLPDNMKGMYDSRGLKGRADAGQSNITQRDSQQDVSMSSSLSNPSGIAVSTPRITAAVQQQNVFQPMFAQPTNLPGTANVFPFPSLGMTPSFLANPAAAAAAAAAAVSNSGGVNAHTNVINGQQMSLLQSQQPVMQNPFNAAALAFTFPPPSTPPFASLPNQHTGAQLAAVNTPGAPAVSNAYLSGGSAVLFTSPRPPAAVNNNGASIPVHNVGEQSAGAVGSSFTNNNFSQQFGNNSRSSGFAGGNFQNSRGGPSQRGSRFPQRGTDNFRGRGGFNRFDPTKRGRGGPFRGERGGGPRFGFRPDQHGLENNDHELANSNNGLNGGGNRFNGGPRRGFGRGGPRFRGAPPFQNMSRFPGPSPYRFPFTVQPNHEGGSSEENNSAAGFDGVDSLFADNRMIEAHQGSTEQGNNSEFIEASSADAPDLGKLTSISLPKLSASEMSNLREIIGATKTEAAIETAKLGGMDEYDDEDDEHYFKALGSRTAVLSEESEQPVSTTQPQSHYGDSKISGGGSATERADEEVSSTTLYDDMEQRPIVTTSAEHINSSCQNPTRSENVFTQNIEKKQMFSSSGDATNMPTSMTAIPRFGRDVPTDAIEVQIDQSGSDY